MCSRTFSVSGTRPTCNMAPRRDCTRPPYGFSAEDGDAAGIRSRQAQQHPDERGLAGAVRPQQGQQFAGPDLQIQIVVRRQCRHNSSSDCASGQRSPAAQTACCAASRIPTNAALGFGSAVETQLTSFAPVGPVSSRHVSDDRSCGELRVVPIVSAGGMTNVMKAAIRCSLFAFRQRASSKDQASAAGCHDRSGTSLWSTANS